jgi:hypothetical protein
MEIKLTNVFTNPNQQLKTFVKETVALEYDNFLTPLRSSSSLTLNRSRSSVVIISCAIWTDSGSDLFERFIAEWLSLIFFVTVIASVASFYSAGSVSRRTVRHLNSHGVLLGRTYIDFAYS